MKSLGKVFLLGDSYSSFTGYVLPDCPCFYPTYDVTTVDKTWWHQLMTATNSTMVYNSGFSGSTVCNTGYGGYCPTESFIGRIHAAVESGKTKDIDTVLILGGTNDCWNGSPIGEIKYGEQSEEDLKAFLPAFCHVIEYIKANVPDARIINIVNSGLSAEITNGSAEICKHYGVECVLLSDEVFKIDGHPDFSGMTRIKDEIIAQIK